MRANDLSGFQNLIGLISERNLSGFENLTGEERLRQFEMHPLSLIKNILQK
jgi:hypothetical protein